jgi:hypothetical protein
MCIPLSLLGNGFVKIPIPLLGNGSVKILLSFLGNGSAETLYTHNNRRIVRSIVFNVARVVSRKVGDYFFPELLVLRLKQMVIIVTIVL